MDTNTTEDAIYFRDQVETMFLEWRGPHCFSKLLVNLGSVIFVLSQQNYARTFADSGFWQNV
jgi:hypothetical protein